jgi:hypothetical protein
MNRIIYKIFPILTLAFALSLTACLTDSEYDNNQVGINPSNNKKYVEVHITSNDNSNIVSRGYPLIGRDTTITQFVAIHLTGGNATSDVTVTYESLSTDTLNANYSYPVDSLININGLVMSDASVITDLNQGKVVIPKGSNTGYIAVKLNPNKLIGNTFIFGIKIKTISDKSFVISNLTDGIVKFGPANMYDGEYTITGKMTDMVNGGITDAYPIDGFLITQSINSDVLFDKHYGDYYHLITSGGSYSVYGSFSPVFTFGADNTVVSITNYYGQNSGAHLRSAVLDTNGINKFDPSTNTLYVSYWMTEAGSNRTHFEEVYKYLGPR